MGGAERIGGDICGSAEGQVKEQEAVSPSPIARTGDRAYKSKAIPEGFCRPRALTRRGRSFFDGLLGQLLFPAREAAVAEDHQNQPEGPPWEDPGRNADARL